MKNRILLAPDADVGQGVFNAGQSSPSGDQSGDPLAGASVGTGEMQSTQQAPVAPAPTAGMTKEEISALVQETARAVAPQPQAPQPQYTQEDFNRAMNVFMPDEALVTDILKGGQDAVAAVAKLVQGVVRQSTTMSAYQMQMLEDKINGNLTPLQAHYQAQQDQQLLTEFLGENKDLEGYESVIKHIAQSTKASGTKFPSKQAAFKHVANEARAFLKSLPGVATQSSGQGQQGKTQQGQAQGTATMAGLSAGSQMGGKTKSGTAGGKPVPGMEVFD